MPKDPDPTAGMTARRWAEEHTAVPDPILADTDLCFDTAEAAGHGEAWAAIEHPDAYTAGPASPRLITAGHRSDAAYCLTSREPVRDGDRGTRFHLS